MPRFERLMLDGQQVRAHEVCVFQDAQVISSRIQATNDIAAEQ